MNITKNIITSAKDISFLTNYEARLALNLASSTDENVDEMVEMFVKWCSDEIATQCGRVFAKETLTETFRELALDCKRLYMSHYPIDMIDSVVENDLSLVENTDYEVDYDEGKIYRLGTTWSEPVIVTYTGGYDLPAETPPALQQAAILMTREAYNAANRGDATIRMIAHKESRIMYFDPNAKGAAASGSGSPARRAVEDLLKAYIRFEI